MRLFGHRVDPSRSGLLRPPTLYRSGEEGRHTTWLEHFFDLVYVFALARIAHFLHDDLTVAGFSGFVFLFVPVWYAWIGFSYYSDQFDTDDVPYRLTIVAAMFGSIALALTLGGALDGGAVAFAASYIFLRVLLIALYVRAWRSVDEAKQLCAGFVASFSLGTAFWVVSILVPEPLRFVLWGIGLVIEIFGPTVVYQIITQVPEQDSHMSERFGFFTIFVLGESVIAVGTGLQDVEWQTLGVVTAIVGFSAAVWMWWLYFGRADERAEGSVISQAIRSGKWELLLSFVYGYGHYFTYAGIVAASIGVQGSIEATAESGPLAFGGRLALCGGVLLFLFGIIANHWPAARGLPAAAFGARLLAALAVAFLLLAGGIFSPVVLVFLVSGVLLALTAFEVLRDAVSATEAAKSG